jgi:hypothetical protein
MKKDVKSISNSEAVNIRPWAAEGDEWGVGAVMREKQTELEELMLQPS